MSTAVKAPPITVEQYQAFEGFPGLRDELICGEIVMSPQPKSMHQQIAKNLERLLDRLLERSPFVAQRDSNIKFEPANSMPAPDVFVLLREVWRKSCQAGDYVGSPPLLVVEIASESNRPARDQIKVELYLNNGVECVWVVDPKKKSVRAYFLAESIQSSLDYQSEDFIPLPSPLEIMHLEVSAMFLID